ncbi:hypothetical protein EV421DRAFT_1906821 [Armillaria borealis]|uniref:Uncharacterized protein n=1 Tax=Armillaria borealis TaxID=47425 RepID=A0AA39MKJ9_9AGAR|nr:hypothetical protein EV421DRAFT_1906821 [Armillaria borealis]
MDDTTSGHFLFDTACEAKSKMEAEKVNEFRLHNEPLLYTSYPYAGKYLYGQMKADTLDAFPAKSFQARHHFQLILRRPRLRATASLKDPFITSIVLTGPKSNGFNRVLYQFHRKRTPAKASCPPSTYRPIDLTGYAGLNHPIPGHQATWFSLNLNARFLIKTISIANKNEDSLRTVTERPPSRHERLNIRVLTLHLLLLHAHQEESTVTRISSLQHKTSSLQRKTFSVHSTLNIQAQGSWMIYKIFEREDHQRTFAINPERTMGSTCSVTPSSAIRTTRSSTNFM